MPPEELLELRRAVDVAWSNQTDNGPSRRAFEKALRAYQKAAYGQAAIYAMELLSQVARKSQHVIEQIDFFREEEPQ